MRTETDSAKSSKEVLAVDADPPVSLTYALGAEPIKTLGDMRSRLIMISDATLKGLQTAAYLSDIASKHGVTGPYETGLVINRADKGVEVLVNKAQEMGLHVLGVIPPDDNVAEYDRMGRPTIELPDDSPSVAAVREILKGIRPPG